MKPTLIYLIRHGESEGNADWSLYKKVPDWQLRLTDKGHKQAKAMAEELYKDLKPGLIPIQIYSSPWYRARETAQAIRDRFDRVQYREDPRLREQEWGNYQEDHLAQKIDRERDKFGTFFYRMPYGESGADVFDRISSFLDTMYRDFEKKDFPPAVCITSHGLTIRLFLMRWFHWTVEEYEALRNPKNCAIIKMQKYGNKYFLETPLDRRAGR